MLGLLVDPVLLRHQADGRPRARRCCSRRSRRRRRRTASRSASTARSTPCRTAWSCSGPNGRVVVANAEAAHLMSLQVARRAARTHRSTALLMRGVAGGMLGAEGLPLHRGAADARAARRPRPQGPGFASPTASTIEFSAREGSQELGVITFEDVIAARRGGGEDPLHGALRQPDRPAEPRLFPRDRRRDAWPAATATGSAASPCSISTTSRASTIRSAIRSATG